MRSRECVELGPNSRAEAEFAYRFLVVMCRRWVLQAMPSSQHPHTSRRLCVALCVVVMMPSGGCWHTVLGPALRGASRPEAPVSGCDLNDEAVRYSTDGRLGSGRSA